MFGIRDIRGAAFREGCVFNVSFYRKIYTMPNKFHFYNGINCCNLDQKLYHHKRNEALYKLYKSSGILQVKYLKRYTPATLFNLIIIVLVLL